MQHKRFLDQDILRLAQIAEILSALGPNQRKLVDDLYQQAMGIMIAAAPTPLHNEWHKIGMQHLRIMSEGIAVLTGKIRSGQEELTEEEERAYQKMIKEDINPFRQPYDPLAAEDNM
jgi:hypothetical protein